jgi:hypothetical protein
MPRVRQLHQAGDDDMFFPASLEQQTMIKNAIARGNAYNDQMISAGIAWANSLLIATIAYKAKQNSGNALINFAKLRLCWNQLFIPGLPKKLI